MAQAKVTASSLNLRTQPNTGGSVIASLPKDTIVDILKTVAGEKHTGTSGISRNDWHEVKVDGKQGFVAAGFVETVTSTNNNNLLSFPLDTPANVEKLARILMSESSVGNLTERKAVGWTVLNRLKRNKTKEDSDVAGAFATNQNPTPAMRDLARDLLRGNIADLTNGATHFYSPQSMPRQGQSTGGFDVGGGFELVPPLTQETGKPKWAVTFPLSNIPGVRPHMYKFHIATGTGRVS